MLVFLLGIIFHSGNEYPVIDEIIFKGEDLWVSLLWQLDRDDSRPPQNPNLSVITILCLT